MSIENKNTFDSVFKIFVACAIGFFGWLGARAVNQFDGVQSSIDAINIQMGEMKTDIKWLKKNQ